MKTLLASVVLIAGCASTTHVRSLASIPISRQPQPVTRQTRTVAVGPFVDARGDEFARSRRGPLAFIFHRSARYDYPEAAGVIQGRDARGRFLTVGSLDTALPALLARSMQQEGVSATPASEWGGADYFVTGRLIRSTLRRDTVPIAAVLGLFGVPFKVAHYDFQYELAVYDAHVPTQPIFVRCYQFHDKRVSGLYYNHDAAYSLVASGLEETLADAARDLTQLIGSASGPNATAPAPAPSVHEAEPAATSG
jgi:hypothetical protein